MSASSILHFPLLGVDMAIEHQFGKRIWVCFTSNFHNTQDLCKHYLCDCEKDLRIPQQSRKGSILQCGYCRRRYIRTDMGVEKGERNGID